MGIYDKSDADLAVMAQAGDKRAFDILAQRHRGLALRLAQATVGAGVSVQDLAQEAALQAYLSLGRLQDPARFRNWYCGIVLNVCRSHMRSQAARLTLERFSIPASHTLSSHTIAEQFEQRDVLKGAIESLSPENRVVVELFYEQQWSLQEIAIHLGINPAAVKGRLYKSRQQLSKRLEPALPGVRRLIFPVKERIKKMILVHVADVFVEMGPIGGHYIQLADDTGRTFDFIAGMHQAWAVLADSDPPNLYSKILAATNSVVEDVSINADKTMVRLRQESKVTEIEVNPADALALAAHFKSPIYLDETLMESAPRDNASLRPASSEFISSGSPSRISLSETQTPSTIRLAHGIVGDAIKTKASAIRLIPNSDVVNVEYRVGEIWSLNTTVSNEEWIFLAIRFKIMADLAYTRHDIPQWGLIPVLFDGDSLELKVTCTPAKEGERILIEIARHNP